MMRVMINADMIMPTGYMTQTGTGKNRPIDKRLASSKRCTAAAKPDTVTHLFHVHRIKES